MSGGTLPYNYRQHILDAIILLTLIIEDNYRTDLDKYGYPIGRNYSPETIAAFKDGINHLTKAYVYANRIDYLLSNDDGEDTFHKRLKEELDNII